MNNIGNKIKTLRKGRGLTQLQFADVMQLSRASISNYETNRRSPSLPELQKMCEYFGVSLDYMGVENAQDESFELLSRAKSILTSGELPKEEKMRVYKELMKMFLEEME